MSGRLTGFSGWNACPWATMDVMGMFSRHASRSGDIRDRDYVLTGCPLVTQDDQVVLVDVTVRLAVRQATDDNELVLGYNAAEEPAMHAVCVVVLRLMAGGVPSDELLTGRVRVTEALEQGFAFAPVGTGVEARVLSVEVRPYAPTLASLSHEFRVVNS
jgi:hypothetical protein